MLKIQSNSRQVPSVKQYTADKKYHDLLYGVLQEMSYIDGDMSRYVDKQNINYSSLGERIGVTRQTASSKFKNLVSIGLITYIEKDKRYRLNFLDAKVCSLVPFETLRAINNSLSENAISIYVYLLKRYIANNEQKYVVTMQQMKNFIGVSDSTTSNNYIINDILNILKLIGLIDVELKMENDKWHIVVKKVGNTLPDSIMKC